MPSDDLSDRGPKVRGTVFVDYVRMMRRRKDIDWSRYLVQSDQVFLTEPIDMQGWYPMGAFERMGVGILQEFAQGQVEVVSMWGRFQTDALLKAFPNLVAEGDPRETLYRFQTMRAMFFDFDPIVLVSVDDDEAWVSLKFGMRSLAEKAASFQANGFLVRLLELAGAKGACGEFHQKSWEGAKETRLRLNWHAV